MKIKKIIYVIIQFIMIMSSLFILPTLNYPNNIVLLGIIILGTIFNLYFLYAIIKSDKK